MIRALFLDLDNCLAAADEAGRGHFQPAFDAIAAANDGRLTPGQLAQAFEETWVHAYDFVAKKFDFSPRMFAAGFEALKKAEIPGPMRGYGDLHVLESLGLPLYLVTSGFRVLQHSKLKALGIVGRFRRIIIDAVDEEARPGKEHHFRMLLAEEGLAPEEVLVVGDNPDSEIEAGNRLGMVTVQTLRPGVARSDKARHHIRRLEELAALVRG